MREKRFDKARFKNRKHQNKRNARVKNFHRKSLNGVRRGRKPDYLFCAALAFRASKHSLTVFTPPGYDSVSKLR